MYGAVGSANNGLAAPAHPLEPGGAHQPSHLVASHVPALSYHRTPHAAIPVGTVVTGVNLPQHRDQLLVTDTAVGGDGLWQHGIRER